ncbi:MAG: cobyric acid synthase [Oscillospiraceae bacterium]
MIQGTMSNVGKSLITTGLCRVFTQDGYSVVPFKSQNMALNSYITEDGLEMGRAQVVQAEACSKSPSVEMNPILLKPTTDVGSQVIVNGKVLSNMKAVEYFKYKKRLIPTILDAYEKLSKSNDIIVIEGAGSPAEINLKSDDIVNMGLAKMVKSPVLLVGDIDRGGVFAQLYGTVQLLEEVEKNLIKGLIINKFRGDKSILQSGLDQIETLCNKKVLGVIPYTKIDIDDEDSLSERLNSHNSVNLIDIAVIKFPHISNFTDFIPLENIEGISLRYVSSIEDFKNPDVVILSGTKNTIADLIWLRENGLEVLIKKYANSGNLIIGICGGYQMLGRKIYDNFNVEHGGTITGLELLNLSTTLIDEKTTTKTTSKTVNIYGEFNVLSNLEITGYEIHSGVTEHGENNLFEISKLGCYKGNIFGTYLHGIFENDAFRNSFIKMLFHRKGLSLENFKPLNFKEYKETQYNLLADIVRNNLDMDTIYSILDGGI